MKAASFFLEKKQSIIQFPYPISHHIPYPDPTAVFVAILALSLPLPLPRLSTYFSRAFYSIFLFSLIFFDQAFISSSSSWRASSLVDWSPAIYHWGSAVSFTFLNFCYLSDQRGRIKGGGGAFWAKIRPKSNLGWNNNLYEWWFDGRERERERERGQGEDERSAQLLQ